jgi:hypothetical protein
VSKDMYRKTGSGAAIRIRRFKIIDNIIGKLRKIKFGANLKFLFLVL